MPTWPALNLALWCFGAAVVLLVLSLLLGVLCVFVLSGRISRAEARVELRQAYLDRGVTDLVYCPACELVSPRGIVCRSCGAKLKGVSI